MSILRDCNHSDYTNFDGPNLIVDEEDVVEPQGLDCRNVEYVEGQTRTRRGFARVWNPNVVMRTMYNWVQQQYNRLVYLTSGGTVVSRDLTTSADSNIITGLSAVGMMCLQSGYRIYMSFYDANGLGTTECRIWDGTFTSAIPNVDKAFQRPPITTELAGGSSWATFAEPGAGTVTAGAHLFAIVVTTWNGYQTKPGPQLSGSFVSNTFTAAGGSTLQITVSPASTWPAWLYQMQIAMTTVDNPNRWYLVPSFNGGGPKIVDITRGSGTIPAVFTIDIDDVTLAGGGPTEITNTLFNLYSQNDAGNGPVSPNAIISYGDRTVYLGRTLGPDTFSLVSEILISEPGLPQYVTANQNILNLPEFRDAVTGFSVGATLYILGPSWTYAYTDNRRVPVLWAAPRKVSEQIGTRFPYGVLANQSRQYAWVADHVGLFYFDGAAFPILPASYYQSPVWNRINFAAGVNELVIAEDADRRLVIVKVPLDGATVANKLLVWDFTNGVSPKQIKFCGIWNIADYANIGAIASVQALTKNSQIWVSKGGSAGDVQRLKSLEDGDATDANPTPLYNDNGSGIDSAYKILAVCRAADGVMQQVGGTFRIRGEGQINITGYSFDQQRESHMAPILATENGLHPGQRFERLLDEQSECVSYEVDNGAVAGAYFYWAALRSYFVPWLEER